METLEITVYFVGVDANDAVEATFPFDAYESAESYADDNPGTKVFRAIAHVDLASLKEII